MGGKAVAVALLDGQSAGGTYLLRCTTDALEVDTLPNLTLLSSTPAEALTQLQADVPQGVMFLGTAIAKRDTEVGRLTDIDLWNPQEYKHQLLSSWHRQLTKAKKEGVVPTNARALFLHHEERLEPHQLEAVVLPMVRRIALWNRFWNNQQHRKKASAS